MSHKMKSIPFLFGMAFLVSGILLGGCRRGARFSDTPQPLPTTSSGASGNASGVSGSPGLVLFQDDFQDGQPQEWRAASPWIVHQAGSDYWFTTTGAGAAWVTQGLTWEEYAFQASVRVDTGSLLLNVNTTSLGRYMVHFHPSGVYLLKDQPIGTISILAQTGPISTSAWHEIEFDTQAGHLQLWVDRALWIDTVDPTNPITVGTIGVSSLDGSQAQVDNILVTRLTAPLQTAVIEAPPVSSAEVPPDVIPQEMSSLPADDLSETEAPQQDDPAPDQAGLPELHASRVSIVPASPIQGDEITVAVSIFNGGEASAGGFNVQWWPEGPAFVGCSWDAGSLPAGETVDLVCSYPGYPQAGSFQWETAVDPDNEVIESDDTNNWTAGEIVVQPPAVSLKDPVNCRAESWTQDSITLRWGAVSDQNREGFRIFQAGASVEGEVGPQTLTFTIENLTAGVEYHFDVRAYNAAGESSPEVCSVTMTLNP
ncbi:MAG: fibronectin type III domain-containing protein [Anaerolineales bacterium]|nr:fibronectin type III domain-containing protein [Anaerolineales bacterium]